MLSIKNYSWFIELLQLKNVIYFVNLPNTPWIEVNSFEMINLIVAESLKFWIVVYALLFDEVGNGWNKTNQNYDSYSRHQTGHVSWLQLHFAPKERCKSNLANVLYIKQLVIKNISF
jgi:hypothetical protein